MTTCGWKDLEITIVLLKFFFKSHFKSNLFSHFHHCYEIGGGSKRIIHTPPNILEGNGVVFGPPFSIFEWPTPPVHFFFQNDDLLNIYQNIETFSLSGEWL